MKPTEPEILSVRRDEAHAQLQLRVPAELHHFDGHFDGLALLPGVVQVDWAIRLARAHFAIRGEFRQLSALKFMRVIAPGAETELALQWRADTGELAFRYGDAAKPYSSGRVRFASP